MDRVVDHNACILGCDEFEYHVCQTFALAGLDGLEESEREVISKAKSVPLCHVYYEL